MAVVGDDEKVAAVVNAAGWHDALTGKRLLLLDFDGPLVRLLPDPEHLVLARRVTDWVRERTDHPREHRLVQPADDHVSALKALAEHHPELVASAENLCRAAELEAAQRREAYPDAVATVLQWLAAGGAAAVVSNNAVDAVQLVLSRTELAGRLDVHAREPGSVARLKPAPDLLLAALAAQRVSTEQSTEESAEEAVMVGDTRGDMQAAAAAGVACIGVAATPERAADLRAAGARHVVARLADLRRQI